VERTDVAVIGAGAAGLAAGRRLARAGVRSVILEARDRIGGRIDTARGPRGLPVERGAEFVHGRPEAVWRLARELELTAREVGEHQLCLGPEGFGPCNENFAEASRVLAGPVEGDPSVASFLAARNLPEEVRRVALSFVQGFDAADPARASAAAIALQAHAAARIDGDRTFRFRQGMGALVASLAEGLDVRLRHVVDEIHWEPERVEVRGHDSGGRSFAVLAGRAVLAVPLAILALRPGEPGAIRIHPDPPSLRGAVNRLATGSAIKIHLRFPSAPPLPPLARGSTAFLHSGDEQIPTLWTDPFDPSLVTGWAGGTGADRLRAMSRSEVIDRILEILARGSRRDAGELGRDLAGTEVIDWGADPFARGGYAWVPVGGLDGPDRLAEPVARTLWVAGEATDLDRMGTVDGALESGERVGRQIADLLG
jgi:monoamine oxidase